MEPNCVSTASLNWRRTAGGLCWTIESLPGLVCTRIACAEAAGAAIRASTTIAAARMGLFKTLLRSAVLGPTNKRRRALPVAPREDPHDSRRGDDDRMQSWRQEAEPKSRGERDPDSMR